MHAHVHVHAPRKNHLTNSQNVFGKHMHTYQALPAVLGWLGDKSRLVHMQLMSGLRYLFSIVASGSASMNIDPLANSTLTYPLFPLSSFPFFLSLAPSRSSLLITLIPSLPPSFRPPSPPSSRLLKSSLHMKTSFELWPWPTTWLSVAVAPMMDMQLSGEASQHRPGHTHYMFLNIAQVWSFITYYYDYNNFLYQSTCHVYYLVQINRPSVWLSNSNCSTLLSFVVCNKALNYSQHLHCELHWPHACRLVSE